jgi:AraC-like DNA-binding protein
LKLPGAANQASRVKSWRVKGINGVECFRARSIAHRYGRHSHRGYAFGVIESGTGGLDIRETKKYIPAGGIVVINPNQVHTGFPAGNNSLTYRMLYIDAGTLAGLLPDLHRTPVFEELHLRDSGLAGQLLLLHRALENSADVREQRRLLAEILRTLVNRYAGEHVSAGQPESGAVRRMQYFLRKYCTQNISITDLMELTGFSRAYLIRAFKKAVGMPPHMYLLQVRIERAKKLLAAGIPVAEVAYETGFTDQSHLTHRFKNITGITPKQYALGHFFTIQS